ncbi:hypothetical protein M885DRAFT_244325, partial [Pelagophyceae sp. CCMP2097]
ARARCVALSGGRQDLQPLRRGLVGSDELAVVQFLDRQELILHARGHRLLHHAQEDLLLLHGGLVALLVAVEARLRLLQEPRLLCVVQLQAVLLVRARRRLVLAVIGSLVGEHLHHAAHDAVVVVLVVGLGVTRQVDAVVVAHERLALLRRRALLPQAVGVGIHGTHGLVALQLRHLLHLVLHRLFRVRHVLALLGRIQHLRDGLQVAHDQVVEFHVVLRVAVARVGLRSLHAQLHLPHEPRREAQDRRRADGDPKGVHLTLVLQHLLATSCHARRLERRKESRRRVV